MNCINHPDREAVAQCCKCHVPICDECRVWSKDRTKSICVNCLSTMRQKTAETPIRTATPQPIYSEPEQPVYQQPVYTQPEQQINPQPQPTKPKKQWLKNTGIFILGIIVGTIVSSIGATDTTINNEALTSNDNTKNDPVIVSSQTHEPEYIVEDISAFFAEYESNGVSADMKYNGKYIQITGKFDRADKDIFNEYFVIIGTGNDLTWDYFQCYFKDEEQLSKVLDYSAGDTITVVGKCGDHDLSITLKDCYLVD